MQKKTIVKVLAVVAVLLLVVAAAGCFGTSHSSSSSSAKATATHTAVPTATPTQTGPVTGVVGDSLTSKSSDGTITWSIDQVIKGSQANNIVASGNMFNPDPAAGNQYVLYRVTIRNDGSDKYTIYPSCWTLYANGVEASTTYAVLPDSYPKLDFGTTLRSGATTSGWVVYEAPSGANLRVYYEPFISFGNTQECYIQL